MQKVYFDASVIIAALLSPSGASAKLVNLVKQGDIVGITSQTVIDEILSHQSKLNKTEQEIFECITTHKILVRNAILLNDIESLAHLMIDKDDAHVFVGAVQTGSDYLVSLDKKHILIPTITAQFPNLHICSPKALLTILYPSSIVRGNV
ncbi:MAG: putative toxin-antitoxin system toxin component, PIN family [bacterium]|nr:putative toxin-antitoxin system toxin component, PIN family [bacterium]